MKTPAATKNMYMVSRLDGIDLPEHNIEHKPEPGIDTDQDQNGL